MGRSHLIYGFHGQMSEKYGKLVCLGEKIRKYMKIAEITSASLLRDFSMRTCSHLALLDKVAKAVNKYQSPHFRMEQKGNQYKDLAGNEEHLGRVRASHPHLQPDDVEHQGTKCCNDQGKDAITLAAQQQQHRQLGRSRAAVWLKPPTTGQLATCGL